MGVGGVLPAQQDWRQFIGRLLLWTDVLVFAIANGAAVTLLMPWTIFDWHNSSGWVTVLYPLWAATILYVYRLRKR